jgi:hypothetical protein
MFGKPDEKKPGLALIIASKMKGKPENGETDDDVEMAKDIIDAIKAEDAEKLAKLLGAFVGMSANCGSED